jgi:HPt (histidine-containing phosphotransfer) domain-containing protein
MLDKNVIAQLIADIGDDVFLRLSGQFLDETINRLATLASSREKEAWTELARHAHSLKSTAQSFGLPKTGEQARLLQLAADNLDIAGIDAILPHLIRITDEECREFVVLRQELSVKLR